MKYLIDPKTGKQSVSLTLLGVSVSCLLLAGLLEVSGVTENTSIFYEFFGASTALYFGRRVTLKSSPKEKDEE